MESKADRLLAKSKHMARHGRLGQWRKTLSPLAQRRLTRKMADQARKDEASGESDTAAT